MAIDSFSALDGLEESSVEGTIVLYLRSYIEMLMDGMESRDLVDGTSFRNGQDDAETALVYPPNPFGFNDGRFDSREGYQR
ncbi:hypothetical protein POX_f07900 [Penicillium oxalicum]|uniref:hypothetical protein n=1 Tax=Penicillium oxalicum TaxID=69781 RepID=UPI0020B651B4|nr:hypothetical protein POX_f07900 [Penicillium oxalicum]KAI2787531.1 hypothetical protein POX_f07900 [Penicillium oxalicum]